jgi:hypothetical protein
MCDGRPSGKSLVKKSAPGADGGGGGGGASEYGGDGVSIESDRQGCGGGGGDFVQWRNNTPADIMAKITGTPDNTRRGSHGCIIVNW